MDQKDIRELLSKYFEGATTEEEESILAEYLAGTDLPEEFVIEKEWFSNRNFKIPSPGKDFDQKLAAVTVGATRKTNIRRRILTWSFSAAAAFTLLSGGYFAFNSLRSEPVYMSDTYDDPYLAMAEVRRVLGEVSGNMKKGTEPLTGIRTLGVAPAPLETFTRAARTADQSLDVIRSTTPKPQPVDKDTNIEKQ